MHNARGDTSRGGRCRGKRGIGECRRTHATNAVRSSCSSRCSCPCSSPSARSSSTSATGTSTRSICRRWSTPARSRRRRSSWAARFSSETRRPRTTRSARSHSSTPVTPRAIRRPEIVSIKSRTTSTSFSTRRATGSPAIRRAAPPSCGLDYTWDIDGNGGGGDPCSERSLDVKATDEDVPFLLGLLPILPDVKSRARIEVRQLVEQDGMLPGPCPRSSPPPSRRCSSTRTAATSSPRNDSTSETTSTFRSTSG